MKEKMRQEEHFKAEQLKKEQEFFRENMEKVEKVAEAADEFSKVAKKEGILKGLWAGYKKYKKNG